MISVCGVGVARRGAALLRSARFLVADGQDGAVVGFQIVGIVAASIVHLLLRYCAATST